MTHTKLIFGALIALGSLTFSPGIFAAELQLQIEDTGETGNIHVYVFTAPDGFPREDKAVVHQIYPAPQRPQNRLDVRITVPEATEYAIMAFQDKNGDGKMNRLLGMIPQEPYGLSRNPKLFGKPAFSAAAFKPADSETQVIRLHD
jgi:uncharacterized protein (DUF2141 family)